MMSGWSISKKQGYSVVKVNSKKGGGIKSIQSVIQEACKEKMERDRKRGILNRPVRAMVVGIPNVGKSTFINALAGKACAKTGNKPGVTKGKQWISNIKECRDSSDRRTGKAWKEIVISESSWKVQRPQGNYEKENSESGREDREELDRKKDCGRKM